MRAWTYFEPDFVRRRFDSLAPFYVLLDWVGLPRGMRTATVRAMKLRPGDRVLEVGCGTGRNFPLLLKAIGLTGNLYGVDFSEEMLRRCRTLCERRQWGNVTLLRSDATEYVLPQQVDAALFSLSYATMAKHQAALLRAWESLRPGGKVTVMDAKTPSGAWGRVVGPAMSWISRHSVLGNPDLRPWENLRAFTDRVELHEKALGTYYICIATKPFAATAVPL